MNEDVAVGAATAGIALLPLLVGLAVGLFMLVASWKIFVKAGQPGWAVLIPLYNTYVFLKIAGKPGWWLILFFIPLANIIVAIIATVAFAVRFGKGAGFAVGLIFLPIIFLPILAFGQAQYLGDGAGSPAATP